MLGSDQRLDVDGRAGELIAVGPPQFQLPDRHRFASRRGLGFRSLLKLQQHRLFAHLLLGAAAALAVIQTFMSFLV